VIPLYKQPEVQEFDCAADRGFFKIKFPSPWPTGSTFSKVCIGGIKAGEDCTTSDDCINGLATGEGSKCDDKTWEEIKIKYDATQQEVAEAIASFSLIDRVRVNFSDISSSFADNNGNNNGIGGGKVCTPEGNRITISFLSTRLDYLLKGDIPQLEFESGNNLKRTSKMVENGQGKTVLTPIAREVIKGVDTCLVEEIQTISCQASGGTFTIALISSISEDTGNDDDADDGSIGGNNDDNAITLSSTTTIELSYDATAAETKAALEELPLIKNVSVYFDDQAQSDGNGGFVYHNGGSFCNSSSPHTVTILFHALHEEFQHRLTRLTIDGGTGGDVPELTLSSSSLTHDTSVILSSSSTESVKGLSCIPFGETYSTSGTREDDRVINHIDNIQLPQMTSGVVHENQDGGSFKIGFLGDYTSSISSAALEHDVMKALLQLPTLKGGVDVSFSGEHACQSPSNVMQITFLGDFGVSNEAHRSGAYGQRNRAKLPPLVLDTSQMPSSKGVGVNGTWNKPLMYVYTDGESDSSGQYYSQNSTKENDVCSNHGVCIESTGICDCFTQSDFGYDHAFGSSNGRGQAGDRGDCGFQQSPQGDPRSVWHEGSASGSKMGGWATVKSSFTQQQPSIHERTWGLNFPITDCPGMLGCSGHGHCSGPPAYRCECAEGWQYAADCSERECPRSPAWFDYPTEANKAHDKSGGGIECGGRGKCDRSTGECQCQAGFTGSSCALTECPGNAINHRMGHAVECSGHGRCLNMKQLAYIAATDLGDAGGFTYGEDPNNPYTWDGDRMRGCACDEFWTGADCSERTCPYGDDPNTHDDVTEVQLLNCTATSGEFTLSFRSIVDGGSGRRIPATTISLPHNVTAKNMTTALEALSTIESAVVIYSNEAQKGFCVGGAEWEEITNASIKEYNIVQIRFVNEIGDLPPITADVSNLVNDPYGDFLDDDKEGRGTGIIHVVTGGLKMHGISSIAGSREKLECSGRGVCNRNTGICDCFPGYASGDGENGNTRGTKGDCGYLIGDRLLRVRGGVGDSDPKRAHGLEDIGREGGTSGNGGHQIGGSYPIEKPDYSQSQSHIRGGSNTDMSVVSEGESNVPDSAQEVLDHVYKNLHHGNNLPPQGYVRGLGRKILSFAKHALGFETNTF